MPGFSEKGAGCWHENIVEDLSSFPFEDETFGTVTFIANHNHMFMG